MEFDLVGATAPIANAIRRISIAEIPTMAIETVFVVNNTSVIPDEILSHRMGLVPIMADPRKFEYSEKNSDPTDANTIVMELRKKCEANVDKSIATNSELLPTERFVDSSVFSGNISWVPQGNQEEIFADDPIRPFHDDILLVKLRPGQEVDLEMHCVKGIGKDHAKWSPVSCSSYRLLPEVTITSPITGKDAEKFADCFTKGVISVEKIKGVKTAVVKNSRLDTVSRECLRHPEFSDKVILSRAADHFIFNMETVGFYKPVEVIRESLSILSSKCQKLSDALEML